MIDPASKRGELIRCLEDALTIAEELERMSRRVI
jgi:hypothetical protein